MKQKAVLFRQVLCIFTINPLSDGIQSHAVLMGGGIQCLPLKLWKIKQQSHVRGQNRGSWVCVICTNMNCHHFTATQKSMPDAQGVY